MQDRASVESRFSLTQQDNRQPVAGRFEWDGDIARFSPSTPLAWDKKYTAELKAGAQDTSQTAATVKDVSWSFATVKPPAVVSTTPKDGDLASKEIRGGFEVQFSSPMDHDGLIVTVAPTITNQSTYWEYGRSDTVARISGGWLASQTYTVTIGRETRTRYGDRLGKDVQIKFTAAPLDPQMYLNVPDMMGMYDASRAPVLLANFTNIARIDYSLYRVERADLIGLLGRDRFNRWSGYTPPAANKLRDWSLAVTAPVNAPRTLSTTLADTPLDPGIYFVRAIAPGVGVPARHLLVVSNLNLTLKRTQTEALVWVTDLSSGKPVANQPLSLYGPTGAVIASGKSDADGLFRPTFLPVTIYEPIFALSESDGRIVAAVGSDWNQGVGPWDFNQPYYGAAQEFYANLYTDRAVYRPGQSVFFRGIVRRDNDALYSLPEGGTIIVVKVRDSQGKEILSQNTSLSRFGTFNGEVKLSDNAPTGGYNVSIELGPPQRRTYSSAGFLVAEYRRPEFQVNVQTDKPEYINGGAIKVDVDASYFFGGAVADAAVKWRLLSDDLLFHSDAIKGYWNFSDYDLTADRRLQGGVIRDGKGQTDSAGKFHFELTADLTSFPLSQNFTLEAEVSDINNQSVASRVTVPVHKGQFYIGMKPQKYVGTAGQEQAVDLVVVDSQGKLFGSQPLAVSFYQRTWYSVRQKLEDGSFYWKSAYTDTLVAKADALSDAQGLAVARFTPPAGGVYRAVGEGTDAGGNKLRSATYLWIAGSDFINWRQENNDRIDLIADKQQYAPGETAEILIPAPFKGAEALLTVERGTIREVRRLTLAGNSERVRVPIRSDYVPNVFISVVLVKGRGPDSPQPQFKLGYVSLSVSTVEKELKVKVTPDKQTTYSPGEKATFTIEASDFSGKPAEAEFSVALVDKAVQSLADDTSASPLQAFYGQRGLGVGTSATLVRSVERSNQTLLAEAKGGGGGALEQQSVRRDFRDTAYWNASVVTDAAGRAQVSVTLPDNLTTWNLTAKGVTASTLVGDARANIVSTLPLLIRPVTPRFMIAGDKVRLEAVVNNNSDQDIADVIVRLDALGVSTANNGQWSAPLKVAAHGKTKVVWEAVVGNVESAALKFSVNSSQWKDGVDLTLPVKRESSAETVGTAGQVDTKIAEQIQLAANADKSAGELQVELNPSLAAASNSGLKFLRSRTYESTEEIISKFFPNVAVYQALKKLGIERADLKRGLETNITFAVQRLYALQNFDGGWGWWSGDMSRPHLTAYALLGLSGARQAGFAVNQDVLNRAEAYLVRYLEQPVDVKTGYAYNERAFIVFSLTEMGRNYTSRAVNLFDQRANLGQYGKAYLLMSLQRLSLPQAKPLLAALTSAALLSATGAHWEEAKPDYWMMNTNTRSTAIIIMALARSEPQNATLASAVRWLMVARKEGHWETTQETAWAILALTEFMQTTGELTGNYSYQVTLNGKPIGDGRVTAANVDQPQTLSVAVKDLAQAAANELIISRDSPDGRLYYSAFLRYYLPVEGIKALNRGIIVGRQYYAVDPQTLKPTDQAIVSAKVGDYVQVKLVVVAPTDLHYLVMEDPLPAGFEAVDTTLKTSSVVVKSPQLEEKGQPARQAEDWWLRPYWSYWAHSEVRDDRVAAFATFLGRGTYEYSYIMRASVAGEFRTPPARAWETYFPDVFGRSAGAVFSIGGD